MSVTADTEIRKLRPAELCILGQILNISDSWKKLMAIVPKDGSNNVPRFASEHFTMVENAVQQQRRNAAEIFLDEWSTMGKKRPTLGILLQLLIKAELFRAADYIAGDILKGELPKRPECGPAAAVDISEETILRLLKEKAVLSNEFAESSVILGTSLEHNVEKVIYFPDTSLEAIETNDGNMQSTKLASANNSLNPKGSSINGHNIINQAVIENIQVPNLIKFSTTELPNLSALMISNSDKSSKPINSSRVYQVSKGNDSPALVQNSVSPDYKKQEMLSTELPVVLNEIRRTGTTQNYEIRTAELPVCLNSQFMSNSSATTNSASSNSSDSVSNESNTSTSQEISEETLEMTSAELPQCVIEFKQDLSEINVKNSNKLSENVTTINQSAMQSQELPIMVLEYNKHF